MRALYDPIDFSFEFYEIGKGARRYHQQASELKDLQRDLSNIMMSDETFSYASARLMVVESSMLFKDAENDHRLRATQQLGPSVVLRFNTAKDAMAFKLAYIEGEMFIPWNNHL